MDWTRYFALMSSFIAREEETLIVLDTPTNLIDLINEILSLNKKLRGEEIPDSYNVITTIDIL